MWYPYTWFLTLPIECKCHMEWSQFITFASSRVHWRGWLCINVSMRPSTNLEGLSKREVSLMSKRSSLKRENHFHAILSPIALSPYTAQMFQAASAAFAPLLNSKRRICRKCSNFCTWHSISSIQGSTHYLQKTKRQYVQSGTTIELNKKWQSINKPVATGIPTSKTKLLRNYAPT